MLCRTILQSYSFIPLMTSEEFFSRFQRRCRLKMLTPTDDKQRTPGYTLSPNMGLWLK